MGYLVRPFAHVFLCSVLGREDWVAGIQVEPSSLDLGFEPLALTVVRQTASETRSSSK